MITAELVKKINRLTNKDKKYLLSFFSYERRKELQRFFTIAKKLNNFDWLVNSYNKRLQYKTKIRSLLSVIQNESILLIAYFCQSNNIVKEDIYTAFPKNKAEEILATSIDHLPSLVKSNLETYLKIKTPVCFKDFLEIKND